LKEGIFNGHKYKTLWRMNTSTGSFKATIRQLGTVLNL
jgi:hypothetical protein